MGSQNDDRKQGGHREHAESEDSHVLSSDVVEFTPILKSHMRVVVVLRVGGRSQRIFRC